MNVREIGSHKTLINKVDDSIVVRYHNTDVISLTGNIVTLNNGGYETPTTKRRMNEASDAFMPGGMGFKVFQKDFEWYIKRDNGDVYHWEGQTITFEADPNKVVLKMRDTEDGGGWYMETDDPEPDKKKELEELASAEQSEAMWEHRMLHGTDY